MEMSGLIVDQIQHGNTRSRLLCLLGNPVLDVRGDAENLQRSNDHPGDVNFIPTVPVSSESLMCMMVVVPAFAITGQSDPPQVS